LILGLFPDTDPISFRRGIPGVFSNVPVCGIAEKHSGAVFPEDSETVLSLSAQRGEHNQLYQGRLDPDLRDCDDSSHGESMVDFRQAKQP
jgi:hypothetical protein